MNGHDIRGDVRLGLHSDIDADVVLGYPSGRAHLTELNIGPGARIRTGSVIYSGSRIGSNLETGHYVIIREDNQIGNRLRIWNHSIIDYGCRIGSDVKIHDKVYIGQYTVIQDEVFLGAGVTLANNVHPGCPDSAKCVRGPFVNKGAQIGINCTILPKVIIGEYSVIGAGSLVTKDIPPRVVAYGNPAQVICDIEEVKCLTGLREGPYTHIVERI